jgi:hypothetical protein
VLKTWSKPARTYLIRFTPLMIAYVVILAGVDWLFAHGHAPAGPLRYLLAAAPGLPVVGVIWAMGAYVAAEPDEFARSVMVQAMLWGLGVTLSVTTVWGFMENFAAAPHLDLYLVFPLFMIAFGIAQPLVRARYR